MRVYSGNINLNFTIDPETNSTKKKYLICNGGYFAETTLSLYDI